MKVEPVVDFEEARKIAEMYDRMAGVSDQGKTLAGGFLALLARAEAAEERERGLRESVSEARHLLQPHDGSYPTRDATMEALRTLIALAEHHPEAGAQ